MTVLFVMAAPGFADIGSVLGNGFGARGAGMGFAQVSVAREVDGIYWNPAALTEVKAIQLSTYASEIYGTSYKMLGVAFPALGGKCGILAMSADQGSIPETALDINGRPAPSGNLFAYNATAFYFAYARDFGKLSLGSSFKYLAESLQNNGANGFGLDVGVLARPYATVSLGAKIENLISPQMKWNTSNGDMDNIGSFFRAGISINPVNSKFLLSGDISIRGSETPELFVGGEYLLRNLSLRGGIFSGRPTLGVGLDYKGFTINYSYVRGNDFLEDSQRVSLSLAMGERPVPLPVPEPKKAQSKLEQERRRYRVKKDLINKGAKLTQVDPSILPMVKKNLAGWMGAWQKGDIKFNSDNFVKVGEGEIKPWREEVYNTSPREKLRKLIYVYSPDKTKFIDVNEGMVLYSKDGMIRATFDVDTGVGLVDLKNKTYQEILFSGPSSSGFDDGFWINDHKFVIAGWDEFVPKKIEPDIIIRGVQTFRIEDWTYVPVLRVYDLSQNRIVSYYGSEVDEKVFWGVIHKALIDNLKNKYPKIEFD